MFPRLLSAAANIFRAVGAKSALFLQKRADAQKINFHGFKNLHVGWGHWNEDGHRAASELVAAQVCAELQAAPKLPNLAVLR